MHVPSATVAIPLPREEARAEGIDRVRVVAAFAVVVCHAAYSPTTPVFAAAPPEARLVEGILAQLAVSFPVNAFTLVSFLLLEPSARAGTRSWGGLLRRRIVRLAPAYLFWSAFYAAIRVALGGRPSAADALRMLLLGTAAAHLYYVPLLVAITAAYPAALWLSRRPALGVAAALALAFGSARLALAVGQRSPWILAALGICGVAGYAVIGFALSRAWGGSEPPLAARRRLAAVGMVLVVAGAALVARHSALEAAAGRLVEHDVARWAGGVACSLGVPIVLLAAPLRVPRALQVLAPLSFGIYLVHPVFVKLLQVAESRLAAAHGAEMLLIVPNAVLALAASALLVSLGLRSPLRRVLA